MLRWSYLESYLLGHTFSLVSQDNRITVTTAFLTCMLPQLKLLEEHERNNTFLQILQIGATLSTVNNIFIIMHAEHIYVFFSSFTVASLLSISGPAFSTAVFWMKQQANSQLSWAILAAASSIISLCWGVGAWVNKHSKLKTQGWTR